MERYKVVPWEHFRDEFLQEALELRSSNSNEDLSLWQIECQLAKVSENTIFYLFAWKRKEKDQLSLLCVHKMQYMMCLQKPKRKAMHFIASSQKAMDLPEGRMRKGCQAGSWRCSLFLGKSSFVLQMAFHKRSRYIYSRNKYHRIGYKYGSIFSMYYRDWQFKNQFLLTFH